MISWLAGTRHRRRQSAISSCATGFSHANAIGASRSPWCISTDGRIVPLPEDELPSAAAEPRGFQTHRRRPTAAGARAGMGEDDRSRERHAGPARDQHHAAMGRLVLVLSALLRSEERRSASSIPKSRITGCPSTSMLVAPSTRCCICFTRVSGTRCFTTSASSRTTEPFQKLVQSGHDSRLLLSQQGGQILSPG